MLKHKKLALGGALLAVTAFAGSTLAAHYSFFGNASVVSGGNPGNAAQLVADAAAPDNFAGVDVSPTEPIAWADLETLSLDYDVTDDDCGGGSPMTYLGVDTDGDGDADLFHQDGVGHHTLVGGRQQQ